MIDPKMKITDLADFDSITRHTPFDVTDDVALLIREAVVNATSTVMQKEDITPEQAAALSRVQNLVIGLWQNHHGGNNQPGSMTIHL